MMRVFSNRQQLSIAAFLLTVATFAMSPPDAFCRTQSGGRNRASRTVRLDDHDHDHSPDLRPDDHTSGEHVDLVLLPEVSLRLKAALTFVDRVEPLPSSHPVRGTFHTLRNRAPPASV